MPVPSDENGKLPPSSALIPLIEFSKACHSRDLTVLEVGWVRDWSELIRPSQAGERQYTAIRRMSESSNRKPGLVPNGSHRMLRVRNIDFIHTRVIADVRGSARYNNRIDLRSGGAGQRNAPEQDRICLVARIDDVKAAVNASEVRRFAILADINAVGIRATCVLADLQRRGRIGDINDAQTSRS